MDRMESFATHFHRNVKDFPQTIQATWLDVYKEIERFKCVECMRWKCEVWGRGGEG